MTRLEPAVFLSVDGVDVARSTVAGVPSALLALDGLAITWGRTEALDQQEPATGTLEVFDPSRRWHRTRDWIGARVELRWELTVAGVPTVVTFFRGRIARINPRLITLAGVRGSLTALDVTSIVTDLANVVPTVTWPYESLGASSPPGRRGRISAAVVAAGLAGGVSTRTDWDAYASRQVLLQDQVSLAEHVATLYDSLVERMSYSPQSNGFTQGGSRDYRTRRSLGILASDPVTAATARAGQGVYARARALNGGAGLYLDGREVDYPADAGVVRDQASAITRIRLSTTDYVASQEVPATVERVVTGADEALTGIRTVDVGSLLSSSASNLQLNRWEVAVRGEVTSWQLEPLTLRTSATGGLEELAQLTALLSGAEPNALVFLQASELPQLGVCPVVGIMGGTLAHADGHWELTWVPAPITLAAPQHPLSWEELDAGTAGTQVQLWDTPHAQGMHASLTLDDLAWVGIGHGVSDTSFTPPDNGWDYLP